jgi:hypothetical protein
MALTTVSEQRHQDRAVPYEGMLSWHDKSSQSVPILVDSTISEGVLLEALGDKYTRMILLSIIDEPKSVIDIAREQNIPISSAYRKIHRLENSRLIGAKGFVITDDGKKYHLYQSRIKSMHISLDANNIRMEFTSNNNKKYKPSLLEQEIPIA